MIPEKMYADYFEGRLSGPERAQVEQWLAHHPEDVEMLLDQRSVDHGLRLLLGAAEKPVRLRQAILAAVEGPGLARLRERVLDAVEELDERSRRSRRERHAWLALAAVVTICGFALHQFYQHLEKEVRHVVWLSPSHAPQIVAVTPETDWIKAGNPISAKISSVTGSWKKTLEAATPRERLTKTNATNFEVGWTQVALIVQQPKDSPLAVWVGEQARENITVSRSWLKEHPEAKVLVVVDEVRREIVELQSPRLTGSNRLNVDRLQHYAADHPPTPAEGAIWGGLIRPEEWTQGIQHALAVTVDPAQFPDLKLGDCLVLPADLDLSALGFQADAPVRQIVQALQTYGAYVTGVSHSGRAMEFYGLETPPSEKVLATLSALPAHWQRVRPEAKEWEGAGRFLAPAH
jgi:hypothetical protein